MISCSSGLVEGVLRDYCVLSDWFGMSNDRESVN